MSTPGKAITADPRLTAVGAKFPRLKQYLPQVRINENKIGQRSDNQIEFYPPWEGRNPYKGQITLEPYRRYTGQQAADTFGGEMFHYIGSVNPQTGQPIDPQYYRMKQAVKQARTPHQQQTDWMMWANDVHQGKEHRSYEDWLQQSRLDAYIRGYITPDEADEWRKNGWYREPAMEKAVKDIQAYLSSE